MFDDTDDKVRRNLVVFSTVICGLIAAGLPLNQLPYFKDIAGGFQAWRVWLLAIAIQIYLLIRFRHIASTEDKLLELNQGYSELRQKHSRNFLQGLIRLANLGKDPTGVFETSLHEFSHVNLSHFRQEFPALVKADNTVLLTLVSVDSETSPFEGTCGLSVSVLPQGDVSRALYSRLAPRLAYSIPPKARVFIRLNALAQLAIYSRPAMDIIVPLILGALGLAGAIVEVLVNH